MHLLKNVLLWVIFILFAATLFAGETVSNQQFGFRLIVPNGFVQDPERVQGKVIHAFRHSPATNEKVDTLLLVSRLGGVLGREQLNPDVLAAQYPHANIVTEKWKDFDIEVFRIPERTGDLQLVTFNAQVPLKPEAIQITVIGEAARENTLRSLLRSVLGNLDGPTNWLNTEKRVSRFVEGLIRLTITVGLLVVISVCVWRAFRKRKVTPNRARPGVTPERPHE